MSNHKKSKECIENIKSNSMSVRNQLRDYLKNEKKEWTPIKSKKELANISDTKGIYYATNETGGVYGKEPYVWLSIRYNGIACAICTVWEEVDKDTNNIHHYFGQLCFIKVIKHESEKCSSPNTCNTTINDIIKRCNKFEEFLNNNKYETVRQKRSFVKLTADNFLDDYEDKVNAENVIALFERWAEQEIMGAEKDYVVDGNDFKSIQKR